MRLRSQSPFAATAWLRTTTLEICDRPAKLTVPANLNPDSPDETASGQLRTPIFIGKLIPYDGSCGGVQTDPTGERTNRRFAQRFRGPWSCLSNVSEES